MHCATHHDVLTFQFIEQDMFVERSRNYEEAPVAKSRMSKAAFWTELRVTSEQPASSLHRLEKAICHLPISLLCIPFDLQFHVGEKLVRLAHAHGRLAFARARTR